MPHAYKCQQQKTQTKTQSQTQSQTHILDQHASFQEVENESGLFEKRFYEHREIRSALADVI
jgi:hypothetical protein